MKRSKPLGILLITLIYILAIVGSYFLYDVVAGWFGESLSSSPLIIILILDVFATIFVYIFSMIFNNASIYDPYWSVMPIFMFTLYAHKIGNLGDAHVIIMLALFIIWGVRLTLNWGYTFRDLAKQDWRYDMYQEKYPKLWPLINLFGIHLFPTIIVFIAMIPSFNYIEKLANSVLPSIGSYFGIIVTIVAIIIETIADIQMHQFKNVSSNHGLVNDKGLWKMCRHPNYFGEILFWVGICIMGTSFYKDTSSDLLLFSPVVMFVMFAMISIPMMEKRQLETKASYKEYVEKTPMILPFGPKEIKKEDEK